MALRSVLSVGSLSRIAISLLAVGFSATAPVAAVADVCDRLQPVSTALGYQVREPDVRCEGLYESTVRAIGIEVVGFLLAPVRFDAELEAEVEIASADLSNLETPPEGPLRVRAVALPLKTYYRMDAVLGPDGTMAWPLAEVIRPAGLKDDQIGIYGWFGEETDKTFVPVRVLSATAESSEMPEPSPQLRLYLRVTSDAERLLWRYGDDGTVSEWLPAAEGRVRAGQTAAVALPPGPTALLRIDVTAKPEGSDDWTSLRFDLVRTEP
ncbi:MAG: hypothetical protein CMM50_01400 [Rhodospirillaceae bacterium]|nr:hypothetical protein [Rhodospirillaceae bacterium]